MFCRFGGVLGRFVVVLGLLGGSFGCLGGSWEALEGSGGRLGSILGGLESPWVVKGRFRASELLRSPSFGRANGGQDEAKMEPKTDKNRCRKRSRKKMLLKIVLERSWGDLGSFWMPSWGPGNAPDTTPADVS